LTGSRVKLLLLLGGLALNAIVLLTSTQQWFLLSIGTDSLAVPGTAAAPALAVLAITGLVLVGALSIAGPFFRVVLGALQVLLGMTVVLSSALANGDPLAASAALISRSTGISGAQSIAELKIGVAASAWPVIATGGGILLIALGVLVVATFRRWPGSPRKYGAVRLQPASDDGDSVIDWDALSEGSDPTAR
jgi:Tryptophan-associated transmembrane protein (Trp_oprn_chp)